MPTPSSSDSWTIKLAHKTAHIDAAAWDACANPDGTYDPFVSHAFLLALEESGSADAQTGWAPHHILIEDGKGILLGAAPLYLKNHSQGEYVFDHGWADAYMRAGGQYYPKFQVSAPFTPVTGRRLLARPGADENKIKQQLIAAMKKLTLDAKVSSLHVTFMPEEEWHEFGRHDFLLRTDKQFHWENRGYSSFKDFLDDLASRKRKNLRKERLAALAPGIEIERVTGDDLQERHWDAFYGFYVDTGLRKWGRPYLTREFFSMVNETLADQTLLVLCKRDGRYIAGALNFIGGDALYGRNWGCVEDHPYLHFETCYYQAIDFAIERGLKKVEAGAQGAHKLARGYSPAPTYSAHYIPDPHFRDAVRDYLEEERRYIKSDIDLLSTHTPFRHANPDKG